jgi:ADP-dependent phosphofructokinase/glucokinase
MATLNETMAAFNTNYDALKALNASRPKAGIEDYNPGDIIACWAGYPHETLCIVELTAKVDLSASILDCISSRSIYPSNSHASTNDWFKING